MLTLIARRAPRVALGVLAVTGGCGARSMIIGPRPAKEWPSTLAFAQEATARGRFDQADSALAAYADGHRGTTEALETAYWRAVFMLDPANRTGSLSAAMASLDGYLADRHPRPHLVEASSLRRIAGQMDVLTKVAANAANQADKPRDLATTTPVRPPESKPAEPTSSPSDAAEIKRLKDELAKANAELERIKRRLTTPPPRW
jgi:hypothetical protein